ncbi:MAG: DUF4091 domain-containing protein [Phycisphaerae bacterium]|nr:DUF4091 domain-containing protein [Phycisphaerae bacterium]
MKAPATILLLVAATTLAWSTAAPAGEHGQPPTIRIPKLAKRPQIDGRLTDPLWKQAAVCAGFVTLDGKTPAAQPTEARVYYTQDELCVGFECKQPNLPAVEVTQRDGEVYRDDSVEVFLDVGCAGRRYHHVVVNAANVVLDEINAGDKWDSNVRSDTVRATDGWSCEIVIPLADVGLTDPANTPLGLNLCRTDAARRQPSSWAGAIGGFHQPEAFGLGLLAGRNQTINVGVESITPISDGKARRLVLRVENPSDKPFTGEIKLTRVDRPDTSQTKTLDLPPGKSWTGALSVPTEEPGQFGVIAVVRGPDALVGGLRAKLSVSAMKQQMFGHPVSTSDIADVWWCEGTYKVGRDRPAPTGQPKPVRLEAARNEYEPVQVVIRPKQAVKTVTAKIEGAPEGVSTEICLAHYVKVTTPTDAFGSRDWYPDALPPLTKPVDLAAGQNHPLWITFYVSPQAKPGDHACTLSVRTGDASLATVPISLHVYDFTLPAETHTETAFGLHVRSEWHGPLSPEQEKTLTDKYLRTLVSHRITPYRPTGPAQIGVKILDPEQGTVELDFAEYDKAAAYCYDELKCTSFNFPYTAVPKEIGPYKRGTPGYERLHRAIQGEIARHLAEKKWLDKCYAYWVDEPPPRSYDDVKAGMDLLRRNCPGLRTLLTINHDKGPYPYFYGSVNLWVPVMQKYDYERARARQKLGECVWWYICCSPRHPYANSFVDHPAINHRIHFWMMEKYGVTGTLYWHTTYWNHKNPWLDPMSYKPDKKGTWGNGDGFLLYPPTRQPSKTTVLDAPVSSIRLAMLREGLEDREYFWLLRQALADKDHAALHLPDKLVRSLVDFELDPQKLYEARTQLAKAIEATAAKR